MHFENGSPPKRFDISTQPHRRIRNRRAQRPMQITWAFSEHGGPGWKHFCKWGAQPVSCLWPRFGFGGCSAPLLISCSYVLSANPASKPTPPNVRYLSLECGVRFPFIYPMSGLPQGCSTPTPHRGFEHRATYFPSASKRCVRLTTQASQLDVQFVLSISN